MIRIRRAEERGHTATSWLDSHHAFSFADYFDPAHVQFGTLRVFNDDTVAPGAGFPPHGHRDMEIVSYAVRGALAHKDSTGGEGVLRAGEVQRMSAGRGIIHSEYNGSKEAPLHFLQMWILPERHGLAPGYEQRSFPAEARRNSLQRVVSPDGGDGALKIHQKAAMYLGSLDEGASLEHLPAIGPLAYVHVIDGRVEINGSRLGPGDAALAEGEEKLSIRAELGPAEILVWDLQ